MAVFNETTLIGQVFVALTNNISGTPFLALFCMFMFFLMIALSYRLESWLGLVILFPFALVAAVISSQFIGVIGAIVFFLAVMMTRAFWLT